MYVSAEQGELHVERGRTLLGAGPRSMINVYPCAGGDGLDAVLECSLPQACVSDQTTTTLDIYWTNLEGSGLSAI